MRPPIAGADCLRLPFFPARGRVTPNLSGGIFAAINHEVEHEKPPLPRSLFRLISLLPILLKPDHFFLLSQAHVSVPNLFHTAASRPFKTWRATTRTALDTLLQGLR